VTSRATFVSVFLTTTVTPGSTAPVASVTTPSILPVAAVCASADAESRTAAQITASIRNTFFIETPCDVLVS
jgi:hypothetical protein